MKTPVEIMLDGVQWRAAESVDAPADGMAYATHEGVLEIAGIKLRCYRLNTGQAVFHADDMRAMFGDLLP
jgi:hypothetical protein